MASAHYARVYATNEQRLDWLLHPMGLVLDGGLVILVTDYLMPVGVEVMNDRIVVPA